MNTSTLIPTIFEGLLKLVNIFLPQDIITGLFLLLMVILYFIVRRIVLLPLTRVKGQLTDSTTVISKNEDSMLNQSELIDALCKDEGFLNHKELREIWGKYVDEVKSVEDNPELCDIEDFVNDDTLINTIGKSQVAEITPGIFTTLGILGTFVGLYIGLQEFNVPPNNVTADVASSMLSGSTESLIGGIKTAFQTSIYGIGFSLTFNYQYRRLVDSVRKEMDKFTGLFKKNIISDSSRKPMALLVKLQKQETEQMALFVESFSLKLAENLNETFLPTLGKLDKMMEQFVNVASEKQSEGLGKVVDSFVQNMNSSLGNQFENLAQRLAEINEWQKTVHTQSTELIDKIRETTQHLGEIDEKSMSMIRHFDEYLGELNNAQKLTEGTMTKTKEIAEMIGSIIEVQKDSASTIADAQKVQAENLVKVQENMELFSKRIDSSVSKSGEAIQKLTEAVDISMTTIEKQMKKVLEEFQNGSLQFETILNTAYKKTFDEFDKSLAGIAMHLSSTIAGIKESVDEMPTVIQAIGEQIKAHVNTLTKNISIQDADLNGKLTVLSETTQRLQFSMKAWQTEFERLSGGMRKLNEDFEKSRKAITDGGVVNV